ncbi:MAG: hypothetical protein KC441_14600, partial [Anaerolineales bacterium]|nr:hypothetical protein [Anaerolineales bacterium]
VNGRIQAIGAPREVLTSANLTAVFHIPIEVIAHPAYGTPLVLPDGVAHTAVRQPAPTKLNGQSPFTYWQ